MAAWILAACTARAWAEDPAPGALPTDRPVAYDDVFKHGRPPHLYRLLSSTEDSACRSILEMLNRKFTPPGPGALADHEYLLHTDLGVAWREIGGYANDGSVWHAFAVVDAKIDGPPVILHHTMLGGYDVQTLFLVAPEVLAAHSDEHGVLLSAFVKDLLTKEVPRSHVTVRTDRWIQAEKPSNGWESRSAAGFAQNNYMTEVLSLQGHAYGLVVTPWPYDDRLMLIEPLVVLAYRLDWDSASAPICVFNH